MKDLIKADLCKTCGGSGGSHVGMHYIGGQGRQVPYGDCSDCQGDGWVFAGPEYQNKAPYADLVIWARQQALNIPAPHPLVGEA